MIQAESCVACFIALLKTRSLRSLQRSQDTRRTKESKPRRQSLGSLSRLCSHQSGVADSATGTRNWKPARRNRVTKGFVSLGNRARTARYRGGNGAATAPKSNTALEEELAGRQRPHLAQLLGSPDGTLPQEEGPISGGRRVLLIGRPTPYELVRSVCNQRHMLQSLPKPNEVLQSTYRKRTRYMRNPSVALKGVANRPGLAPTFVNDGDKLGCNVGDRLPIKPLVHPEQGMSTIANLDVHGSVEHGAHGQLLLGTRCVPYTLRLRACKPFPSHTERITHG
jgi:hypothetical protein